MANNKGNKRIRQAVLKAIKAGSDKEAVAREWGVSIPTLYRWLAKESNDKRDISNDKRDISNDKRDISNVQSDISNDKRPSSAFEKAKNKLGYPIKCKDGTELYY